MAKRGPGIPTRVMRIATHVTRNTTRVTRIPAHLARIATRVTRTLTEEI